MPRAAHARTTFNGGEVSTLVEGRIDIDRYPGFMRAMLNFVATPQGPAIRRSGTQFMVPVYDEATHSALIPFIFSEEQALCLEFAHEKIRFILEAGVQVYSPVTVSDVVSQVPFTFTAAGHGVVIGDQVSLAGFPTNTNVNGRVFNVSNVAGDDVTVSGIGYAGAVGAIVGATTSKLYIIDSPYDEADVRNIRYVQSVDVLFLLCDGYKPRKLTRKGAYDWVLVEFDFQDGPYLVANTTTTQLSISTTGSAVATMTADNAPVPLVASSSGISGAGKEAFRAFDANPDTFWQSNTDQTGTLQVDLGAGNAVALKNYTIYIAKDNTSTTYTSLDYAPGSWVFQGSNDAVAWTDLDRQTNYTLYEDYRSVSFPINTATAYRYYRIVISELRRNGTNNPRIARLLLGVAGTSITITASATTGINRDTGFQTTDIGRLIRIKGSDQRWRWLKITGRTSTTVVTATLMSEPFPDTKSQWEWRLGAWSDTTGWPICATFFEDRLWMGGAFDQPDLIGGSRTGAYEDFAQTAPTSEVLDDNAIVVRLNARRMSRIRWIVDDERGLLTGTGTGEWVLRPGDSDEPITARNVRARQSTSRGSAAIEPVRVDKQTLFIQASRRSLREHAYVFEADGYKSPSMSLFASHLGNPRFIQMDYAGEPYSNIWIRRDDGSLVALTYLREENVVGWHRHALGGDGVVESLCVIPSITELADIPWLIVTRTINGQSRRYIERMRNHWDFGDTLDTAHFVDCGVRYQGAASTEIYGLSHLEGVTVAGLADGVPFTALVIDGRIELGAAAENVIAGFGYESFGEIVRPEAGSADGSAQGKMKRPNECVIHLWDSAKGEIGKWNDDQKEYDFDPVKYEEYGETVTSPMLNTAMIGPHILPTGYDKHGTLAFRQTEPLPFNVIALYPKITTNG